MFTNDLINKGILFEYLTLENIQDANLYFANNPSINKYSRKQSKLLYSFIKSREGLFAISRITIRSCVNGKLKIARHLETGKTFAIEIKLAYIMSVDGYEDLMYEPGIHYQLGRLFATSIRWIEEYKDIKYNLKFYTFTTLLDGITLATYLQNTELTKLTTEKILHIVIKILEQLEIFHHKNILHGDINFNNILITEILNGDISINLINFGLAAKLRNGFARCKLFNYEYNSNLSSIAPESDCDMVLNKILPELKPNIGLSISEQEYYTIYSWARRGYGFNMVTSDLYSLSWNICHFINLHQDSELAKLLRCFDQYNPSNRQSLQFFMDSCKTQAKAQQIQSEKTISSSSELPSKLKLLFV